MGGGDDDDGPAFGQGPLAHHPVPPEGQPDLAYESYRTDLNAKRNLWSTADQHRQMVRHYGERMAEPELTEQGRAKFQRRQDEHQRKFEGAKAGAKVFGVDVDKPFPRDEAISSGRPYRPRSPGFRHFGTD